jgi:Glycosyl transferases group 1
VAIKDVNIFTSLCGKGLEREAILLKELLAKHDVYCNLIHYTNYNNSPLVRADFNFFLEIVHPLGLSLSRENFFFPNSEWFDARNDQFLPRFTKICCKTRDCERIWKAKLSGDRPERVVYTGFEPRDLYRLEVVRESKFLALHGESEFKGTEAVIGAWKQGNWAVKPLPLTVVTRQKKYQDLCQGIEGVTCVPRATEEELVQLLNSHWFHLIPSAYEGFGHSVHESLMCGGLVLTTDAPPMSEFAGVQRDWAVSVASRTTRALAELKHVTPVGVQVACGKAIALADNVAELERRSRQAREAALVERESFRQKFLALVGVC